MYLSIEKYIGGGDWAADTKDAYATIVEAVGVDNTLLNVDMPFAMVNFSAYYWRKCNAIHNWFVMNVQAGEDDCASYYVSKESLQELIVACKLDDLEPVPGFFFGGQEKDDYYYHMLQDTITGLQNIVDNLDWNRWAVKYQSSW